MLQRAVLWLCCFGACGSPRSLGPLTRPSFRVCLVAGSHVQRSCRKSGQHIETPVTRNGFHLIRQRTSAYTMQYNRNITRGPTVLLPGSLQPCHPSTLQGCLARQGKGATRRDTQHTTSLLPAATGLQHAACSLQPSVCIWRRPRFWLQRLELNMRQSLNPATVLRAAVACAVACTASADHSPDGYTLLSGGTNGDCRSGGEEGLGGEVLPYLASAVGLNLTACSDACNEIEECAAFALVDVNVPANCQLIGLDIVVSN